MDKINSPRISIVMATYNRADELDSTINNIFEQDYKDLELLVINDGSTDSTLSVLQNLQTKYDIVVINNSQNLGLQKSLNIGLTKASGKYIARIDDHDKWIDNKKLSKQVAFLESNTNVGIVGTGYKYGSLAISNPLTDTEIRRQILMRSPFCHVSVLMVKSIVEQVGGYNEELLYSEDWELWLKIGQYTQLANLPDITVQIEEDDISLSQDFYLKQLPINRQLVKQYYKRYPLRTRAYLYHHFISFFFAIFPLNGSVHKMMRYMFLKYFDLTSNKIRIND